MRRIFAAALAGLALSAAAPALAQDYNATPTFGEFHLTPGFTPDPGLLSVQSGGSIDAADWSKSCKGFIANAPDLRMYWDGTGSLSLIISAVSNADVTLVVNGPNGEWYCDDDSGDETNPSLTLRSAAGQYDIWIGTFSSGDTKPAVLAISEVTGF